MYLVCYLKVFRWERQVRKLGYMVIELDRLIEEGPGWRDMIARSVRFDLVSLVSVNEDQVHASALVFIDSNSPNTIVDLCML